jgi:hypothetical protein
MSVKQVVFDEASSTADWTWQYRLLQQGHAAWDADEEIVLGMSPDYAAWDDYGHRSRSFPLVSNVYDAAPLFQFSSRDGNGVVVVTDPNLIDIRVPYGTMRQIGPGSCHVTLSWRRVMPVVNPLVPDLSYPNPATVAHKLRIWSQRMGVPVSSLMLAPMAPGGATSRVTLVTGTLPVIDGVV